MRIKDIFSFIRCCFFVIQILILTSVVFFISYPQSKDCMIIGYIFDSDSNKKTEALVDIGDIIISDGQFTENLPFGNHRIKITKGFEYEPIDTVITINDNKPKELNFYLKRFVNMKSFGWYNGELHYHLFHDTSGYKVNPDSLILLGKAVGLDYFALAHSWGVENPTPELLNSLFHKNENEFILTWNMEMPKNYWKGDVSFCLGHCWYIGAEGYTKTGKNIIDELYAMNAHDYELEKIPTPNFDSISLIKSLGGISIYAHPLSSWYGKWGGRNNYPIENNKFISNLSQELPFNTVIGPLYDGIDILYRNHSRDDEKLYYMLLNKGYRIAGTATSDGAFMNERGTRAYPGIYRTYTYISEDFSISNITKNIKKGRNIVTNGALILFSIDNNIPGDIILADGKKRVAKVKAWASGSTKTSLNSITIIRNGDIFKEFQVPQNKKEFEVSFEIEEKDNSWYIAKCYDSNKKIGITNPIFFENKSFSPPKPTQAYVKVKVYDKFKKNLLPVHVEILNYIGRDISITKSFEEKNGEFTLNCPATARIKVSSPGYKSQTKSIFIDYNPLLEMNLNIKKEDIIKWDTYEKIMKMLKEVVIEFPLEKED